INTYYTPAPLAITIATNHGTHVWSELFHLADASGSPEWLRMTVQTRPSPAGPDAESCNEHRSLLTVHGGTWKQQVNPFSPRADTPIHQFVSVSLREKSG
ncbi:unnamed protein product, partial [Tetraodon nigroviridis]